MKTGTNSETLIIEDGVEHRWCACGDRHAIDLDSEGYALDSFKLYHEHMCSTGKVLAPGYHETAYLTGDMEDGFEMAVCQCGATVPIGRIRRDRTSAPES